MTLLLDTNILLWWLEDSPRLPKRPRRLINRGGKVLVSAATVWEIAVKKALGKLKAPNKLLTSDERLRVYGPSVLLYED